MNIDWNIVTTILLFILGSIGSVFGWFMVKQNKDVNRIKMLEDRERVSELQEINQGIKRIHRRIDNMEETQEVVDKLLHDGEKGIFIRLNTLEHKTGVKT